MITYREFLNTDHPLIIDIWRHQNSCRGRVELVSRQVLDLHVFGKPYFERSGMLLAIETDNAGEERPIGFVHAGFGPTEDESDLDHSTGIICQLQVLPQHEQSAAVAQQLLGRACEYLKQAGSTKVYSHSQFPYAPFYLGMYGGSRIPGVLINDTQTTKSIKEFGFSNEDEILLLERNLVGFRAVVDRQQMTVRRQYNINPEADPMESSWWECCTLGLAQRDAFKAYDRKSNSICGRVIFWDIQPLATEWSVAARGLYGLEVDEQRRGQGLPHSCWANRFGI